MSRKRFFVGVKGADYELFSSALQPLRETHPQYGGVIGPFRTKRGAEFMVTYGYGNPHCCCVADAERLAKKEKQ